MTEPVIPLTEPHTPLVRFARALRAAGVRVGTGQVAHFCQAVAVLGPRDRADVYWAGRTALVSRAVDIPTFDAVFAGAFGAKPPAAAHRWNREPVTVVRDPLPEPGDLGSGSGEEEVAVGAVASPVEILRHKRFADLSDAERAAVRRLMSAIRLDPPLRHSRRTARARSGRRPDLPGSLRRALRTHGEVVDRQWRRRQVRPRRLVLLLDVSGSMSDYSRVLLGFGHAVARAGGQAAARGAGAVEVFCFGTRITRVTGALAGRDPDTALAAAAAEVVDWDGGTRIGASIGTFVRRWGKAGMARGAVVVVCSDGLERDDPERLATEMARLGRLAHRVVWVNPLKGDPRYRPLARGMAAALPSIDVFLAGHNLASLEALASVIAELS
jgi:uncharacterized protein